MGLTDWMREHLLAMVVVALAFGTLATVSALGLGAWLFLLLFVPGGQSALGGLVGLFAFGLVVGVPVTAVALIGVAYGLLARAADAATGGRIQRAAGWIERHSDLARAVGLADLAESVDARTAEERAEDRIAELKERYVRGDLSEREMERRIREVLDDEGVTRDGVDAVDRGLERGRE